MEDPTLLLLIKCPHKDCVKRTEQTAQVKRSELAKMLKANSVEVIGSLCGHQWFLKDWEIVKLNKRIATGAL
jgi:hypothetical protein